MLKAIFFFINLILLPTIAGATAQIPDRIIFQGENYDLIGKSGGQLFTPKDFDMDPVPIHSACWRGFYSTYNIKDKVLFLEQMTLAAKDGDYRPINKSLPQKKDNISVYKSIDLRVPFTGKLRLARDFIRSLYVHMGFQKASAYKVVLDLTFHNGELQKVDDRSKQAEKLRGEFKKHYENEEMKKKIEEAFSLDMDRY